MSSIDVSDVEELQAELERMNGNINGLFSKVADLNDRLDAFESRLSELENDVTVMEASVPEQSKTKLDNVMAVIDHAYQKKNGGHAGVKIKSGELTAVINGSKQTGLRLLNDIAGQFQWAEAEKPAGPKEHALKIRTDEPLEERKQRVAQTLSE